MRIPDVDPAQVDDLIKTLETQIAHDYTPPHFKRDAHPKVHGCVQGVLEVCPDLPEHLREGLFAHPRSYCAWVRFSNAFKIQHDLEFETRGMAIKLVDVGDAPRALTAGLEGDRERRTQDFLLATHDAFFLPSMKYDYQKFAEATAIGQWAVFKFFWHQHLVRKGWLALIRSAFVKARNPLAITYHSQTPYAFGDKAVVKLRARPRWSLRLEHTYTSDLLFLLKAIVANGALAVGQWRAKAQAAQNFCDKYLAPRDLLRYAMMETLAAQDVTFDITVQSRREPIESIGDDATKRWSEATWPFERVATLTIPRQVFWPAPGMPEPVQKATERMMALGENMSFNPWHALRAHMPLGSINEARARIYTKISQFRRSANVIDQPVPTEREYLELKQIVRDGLMPRDGTRA